MKPYNDAYTVKIFGDISRADAVVLSELARRSKRILEFGVGASSYIFHQNADSDATILHVDTNAKWIELTKNNLAALVGDEYDAPTDYRFCCFDHTADAHKACAEVLGKCQACVPGGKYDLILVDGYTPIREAFMGEAWPYLAVGGSMVFHDSRREWIAAFVANLVRDNHLNIEKIDFHPLDSNMIVVKRGVTKQYFDWNKTEAGNNRENPLFTTMKNEGQS